MWYVNVIQHIVITNFVKNHRNVLYTGSALLQVKHIRQSAHKPLTRNPIGTILWRHWATVSQFCTELDICM